MKVLLDTCISGAVRDELVRVGHDALWAGDWPEDPGDEEILARSHQEGRALVTLDKDFGELAVVHGLPHAGILRLVNLTVKQQAQVCLRVLDLHGADLQAGAIVTAEAGRLRVRPPEMR